MGRRSGGGGRCRICHCTRLHTEWRRGLALLPFLALDLCVRVDHMAIPGPRARAHTHGHGTVRRSRCSGEYSPLGNGTCAVHAVFVIAHSFRRVQRRLRSTTGRKVMLRSVATDMPPTALARRVCVLIPAVGSGGHLHAARLEGMPAGVQSCKAEDVRQVRIRAVCKGGRLVAEELEERRADQGWGGGPPAALCCGRGPAP
mmetsp:Transcript_13633/g.36506  ORF Transcript_13633/g.36506 Transcript_13633/m.36506 type:complete len:201 (+) Transcript_13633:632-1234(+)